MESVVLVIHLLIAIGLVGAILLQKAKVVLLEWEVVARVAQAAWPGS